MQAAELRLKQDIHMIAAPDPWSQGSTTYRVVLIGGMAATAVGIVWIIISSMSGDSGLPIPAVVLLLLGLMLHLIGVAVRMRQARQDLSQRTQRKDGT